jgi:hypothetical protein
MKQNGQKNETQENSTFIENVDYYFENDLMILTAKFLLKSGY